MGRSIPVSAVHDYLGCKRPQIAQLIEAGILRPIAGQRDGRRSVSQGIDAIDLDAFVARLRSVGHLVSGPSSGMSDIVETAEALKVPAVRIVELLLCRKLETVELLDEELRYRSVLVNQSEVGRRLGRRTGLPGKSITDVGRELGLSATSVGLLLRQRPDSMDPVLRVCGQTRHIGKMRDLVDPASLDLFKAEFMKIKEVAARMSNTDPDARNKLRTRGIFPVWDPKTIGAEFYRISEL